MAVRKAVIPVAGFGTRFLPVTKAIPKVLIPVLDHPAIHYCVEEASRAGIRDIVFVVSNDQEAIGRYFDSNPELENHLASRSGTARLDALNAINSMVNVTTVLQEEQRGLGHAVLMARDEIGNEAFAVFLPDDIIRHTSPTIAAMVKIHEENGANVLAVKQVPDSAIPNLGIIDPDPGSSDVRRVRGMVEKPKLEEAPSDLAIIGRYVLAPEVFDAIERAGKGALGEIQITDAIAKFIDGPGVFAYLFPGDHFDVGMPLGMLKAAIHEGLGRDDMRAELVEYMNNALESGKTED
ncbi:MAG: UTP--glucose-1-phosphate uridylyltransferase [SAR202 cluster bacterium]|jgi:UTP--glucose-1-phosphate uridylyltransferase|nr:UTP--glucose-1-phosphate uridylyltransferase [SAR202 cluster bacterium]|tara:strand:+ start:144 stop:1025 length:882 start_codon:yes stop_codon:yes gene_type:complete